LPNLKQLSQILVFERHNLILNDEKKFDDTKDLRCTTLFFNTKYSISSHANVNILIWKYTI